MRCPKCQYITFDSDDRCRNCGYEFSLSSPAPDEPVEVRIARDEPESVRRGADAFSALDTPLTGASGPADRAAHGHGARRGMTPADLPLFIESVADDQAPLVTPNAVPRPPLAVRKAPPIRPRPRGPAPDELPLGLPDADAFKQADAPADAPSRDQAGVARRLGAGVIDVTILGTIAAGVVLLTLRVSQLTVEQWRVLPLAPMLAFLLLLCGGYFVLFTAAGGQTIGKMATRIRVVNAADNQPARVPFRAAVVRTVSCLGSVLALGTGFLPVLFSGDRRAFHDRVAETRVVAR
jgi:uncharacterized RDD family membrane protein YckC